MTLIESFKAMEIGRLAISLENQGRNIIHMEYGQPTAALPASVKAAVQTALEGPVPGYWESNALRQALVDDYAARYGATIKPEQIFLTCGASPALVLALSAGFKTGARIAMARPGYVAYRNTVRGLGMEALELDCGAESRFQITAAKIAELNPLPDGVIIASPANPTGTIIPPDEMRAIANFCDANNIRLISDEIYHRLSFGSETLSITSLSPQAFVINSFSKYFCLPGWRIGWLVAPRDMIEAVNARQTNYFLTAPSLSQTAALAAMKETDYFDGFLDVYKRNRDLMLKALPKLGFAKIAPPDGAFYIYTDISQFSDNSLEFCKKLLIDTGVATTPGLDFDPVDGHKYMRLSYPQDSQQVETALGRIEDWINSNCA
ncbi:MAG: aminotransferase class I/II-fold pyridoxal phosphate-dependent enzyme [Maricaulaceae bacterium]